MERAPGPALPTRQDILDAVIPPLPTRQDILDTLIPLVKGYGFAASAVAVDEDSRFDEDLGFDSLDNIEAIIDIESIYGVEFEDSEPPPLTVGEAADRILDKLAIK